MKKINKKIYLKKIDQINGIDIWEVNGNKIRSELDIEFVNFGHTSIFPYIPKKASKLEWQARHDKDVLQKQLKEVGWC